VIVKQNKVRNMQILKENASNQRFVTRESEVNRICCGFNGFQLGERLRRDMKTSSITTLVVNTTTYFFKDTTELIDFKVRLYMLLVKNCKWCVPLTELINYRVYKYKSTFNFVGKTD